MSHNQVLDDSPWLAPDAIDQIDLFLESRDAPWAFEWGAGGSTLFLARRVKWLVSVEHHFDWYEKVNQLLLARTIPNVRLFYFADPFEYVREIDGFYNPFDLVLVDGIQRNACTLAALAKVAPTGWLVLDNTERETEYAEALELLKDWPRQDYQGDGFTTSIFIKP